MKWTTDRSIKLSIACVFAFSAILMALDVWTLFGWIAPGFGLRPLLDRTYFAMFSATVAFGSVFAWACLINLYRLLKNVQAGRVFTHETADILRIISWCCACAALVCLISAFYALPFLVVAIAAAFMMLIVRIVKNCFQQAIGMKSELDLTI